MSLGFNLSTKKEDVSTKLKTQNLKRAKQETRKLEYEGKKMEERLMELKLAMNREKEERERQGGGFWRSGQTGTLNNYPEEVLTKKKKSASGKTKIKILRDTPLDIPERNNQPGTMAYIAQKGSTTPRDKPKGPKCGQCEERGAAVSCLQCAEDYCAGCFAAFHLKGNLKKHRSVPLTATPRQCFASPRLNPAQMSSSFDSTIADGGVAPHSSNSGSRKDRNSPEGASGSYDASNLLQGSYDEAEQAASFQEALQAWRNGKTANQPSSPRHTPTPRRPIASPVKTPRVNVDSGTVTTENTVPVEIKFNTSGLSYADRLLLKKHRRTDVDALFTPRSESSESARPTPRSVRTRPSQESLRIEEFNEDDFADEERVDFQALFDAVQSTQPQSGTVKGPDSISIVEVQGSISNQDVEQTTTFKVQEVDGQESWVTNNKQKTGKDQRFEAKPPTSAKSRNSRSGRRSSRKTQNTPSPVRLMPDDDINVVIGSPKMSRREENQSTKEDPSAVLSSHLKNIEDTLRTEEKISKANDKETSALLTSARHESSKSNPPESKSRPQSRKARPQSGKSRPSSARKKETERVPSRQASRNSSRANSRMGSARSRSRIDNPGLLTKGPSEALASVARMTPTSDHDYRGMDTFFLAGVKPSEEQEERTLTPTKHKNTGTDEKYKVSYQLYSMAPRSWKPDFSIADSVPVDQVDNEDAEDDRASSVMAYHAYSEQMVSEMTDRLVSRFGELPLQNDDELSDMSSASLGEEYRTHSSMSARNSPIPSARATPVPIHETRVTTPRMSARLPRGQTPRSSASRVFTPRNTHRHKEGEDPERPISRAIVMEGTDLSIFDDVGQSDQCNREDEETLDQLEWELASESGRITAEGKISRMEILDETSGGSANSSIESLRSLSRLGQEQGYDINSKLKESELEDENDILYRHSDDEDDVRNLF